MRKLQPKQARFVEEYLIDLNATQAAIRAGYSKKTAEVIGHELLKKTLVAEAVTAAQARRSDRLEITADKWLQELAIVGFSDLADYVTVNDDTGAIRAKSFEEMLAGKSRALEFIEENRAIKEDANGNSTTVYDKYKFKMHDKLKALEIIGKHLGFLKDRVEHTGKDGEPIRFLYGNGYHNGETKE